MDSKNFCTQINLAYFSLKFERLRHKTDTELPISPQMPTTARAGLEPKLRIAGAIWVSHMGGKEPIIGDITIASLSLH